MLPETQLLEIFTKTNSLIQTAAYFNCTSDKVRHWLKKYGKYSLMKPFKTVLTQAQHDQACEMYKNDVSVPNIAKQLGCQSVRVQKILKDQKIFKPHWLTPIPWAKTQQLLDRPLIQQFWDVHKSRAALMDWLDISSGLADSVIDRHQLQKLASSGDVRSHTNRLKRGITAPVTKETFLELNKTHSLIECSKKMGISNGFMRRKMVEWGITEFVNHQPVSNVWSLSDEQYKALIMDVGVVKAAKILDVWSEVICERNKLLNITPPTISQTRKKLYLKKLQDKLRTTKFEFIQLTYKPTTLTAKHTQCGTIQTLRIENEFNKALRANKLDSLCKTCCPNVYQTSKPEQELFQFVQSLGLDAKNRDKSAGFELDIYIPSLKIGIEFCGLYWHSSKFSSSERHINKLDRCTRKGIRLLTIFEDEWKHDRVNTEAKLRKILLDKETREAVQLISKQGYWEMPEVFSAKQLQITLQQGHWKTIVVKLDRRWNDGAMYEDVGFLPLQDDPPVCWMIKQNTRICGEPTTKAYTIYDCGYRHMVLHKNRFVSSKIG